MNHKGFANIILVFIVVILVGAVGYFVFVKKSGQVAQQPTPTPTPVSATANLKAYTDTKYSFEFKYPQNFLIGKFKPEVTPSSNVPPDIQEKQRDLSLNNAIVLIESEQKTLFAKSPKDFSIDSIPVGEVPVITIKPITTSADFYRRNFIDGINGSDKTFEGKNVKIGEYAVTKLPGYPGPYGDAAYYYLLPLSDNLIIEFTGFKQKIITNTTMTESHYDKVIEQIIVTFKLTQ